MLDIRLLGVCGLYCGSCYHYRASFPEGKHLIEEAARRGASEGFICRGCRSDKLYIHPGCAECNFRACAEAKKVVHCALFREFPCPQLKAFQSDGRPHHSHIFKNLEELLTVGLEQWLSAQQRRWKCDCGASFSWYEVKRHNCGERVESYGPDPQTSKELSSG